MSNFALNYPTQHTNISNNPRSRRNISVSKGSVRYFRIASCLSNPCDVCDVILDFLMIRMTFSRSRRRFRVREWRRIFVWTLRKSLQLFLLSWQTSQVHQMRWQWGPEIPVPDLPQVISFSHPLTVYAIHQGKNNDRLKRVYNSATRTPCSSNIYC